MPSPVVTEPKDTTSIGVTEAIGLGDCFQLINHPFDQIGSVDVQPEWVGGSWSVWSSVGQMMSSGKNQCAPFVVVDEFVDAGNLPDSN